MVWIRRLPDAAPAVYIWTGWIQSVSLVVAAVFVIRWTYIAYRNLEPLGSGGLRFRPFWAVIGWFVPIWWFFRPKQIVNGVWRASDPALEYANPDWWSTNATPRLLSWWWAAFLFSTIGVEIAGTIETYGDSAGALRFAARLVAAADLVDLAAALLLIRTIGLLTARQEARSRLSSTP